MTELKDDVEANRPAPGSLVISVRQPWAWLIFNGKDIENRDWYTKVRGQVFIHASKGMTNQEYLWALEFAGQIIPRHILSVFPGKDELARGGIIGSVEIVDCVTRSDSRWFRGRYGFVLRDQQPLPFYPYRGHLGFFKI